MARVMFRVSAIGGPATVEFGLSPEQVKALKDGANPHNVIEDFESITWDKFQAWADHWGGYDELETEGPFFADE